MIYFIRAGTDGPVKIGWARDVEARLRHIQTHHYQTLRVIRLIEDAHRSDERWLHERFAQRKLLGEWFQFDPEMLVVQLLSAPAAQPVAKKIVSWAADMCWHGRLCEKCLRGGGWSWQR